LAKNLTKSLDNYALKRKINVYVKDSGANLNTMITTLKLIVSYDVLGLKKVFRAFVLVMHFKGCKYATIEKKICKNLRYVSIKIAQRYV
jgi:hypothetical protein